METKTLSVAHAFIVKYLPFAKATETKTGISAVFILAQAALESGWGKSAQGNMFFGVKANPHLYPIEKRQLIVTTEVLPLSPSEGGGKGFPEVISVTKRADGKYLYKVKDWFRKYATPEECFTDHANFFFKNPRYAKALVVRNDAKKFAEEIAKAGYATAPNYADSLKKVIATIERLVGTIQK